jgi:hypothetical protein
MLESHAMRHDGYTPPGRLVARQFADEWKAHCAHHGEAGLLPLHRHFSGEPDAFEIRDEDDELEAPEARQGQVAGPERPSLAVPLHRPGDWLDPLLGQSDRRLDLDRLDWRARASVKLATISCAPSGSVTTRALIR